MNPTIPFKRSDKVEVQVQCQLVRQVTIQEGANVSEIGFFPSPLPDEDFRSVVYRYHVLAGYSDLFATMSDLFGVTSEKNLQLPRNATALLEMFPGQQVISINDLLQNNTLWPLIRPFLPKETVKESMQDVLYGVEGPSNVAGRQLSGKHDRILAADIRYCPTCLTEDQKRYGYSIVHRSHQIQGIDICIAHHVKLITTCPTCGVNMSGQYGNKLLIRAECPYGHQISDPSYPTDVELAEQTELYNDLLAIIDHSESLDREEIIQRFEIALVQKGYMHLTGRLNKSKLRKDITSKLLDQNSRIGRSDLSSNTRTFKTMLRSDWRMSNLPAIVFLMKFLCGSVKEFLTNQISVAYPLPFGTGPWPCINKVCPDHSKPVILTCKRQLQQANFVSGVFVCPTCGCTYHKRWSGNGTEGKPKISTMGTMWENRLIELSAQGLTFSEMAHKMKTQWTHIVTALGRLNLPPTSSESDIVLEKQAGVDEIVQSHLEVAATDVNFDDERAIRHRQAIIELIQSDEKLKRTDIYRLAPGAWAWLKKHEPTWLEQVLPTRQHGGPQIDWTAIDVALAERVKQIAEQLYASNPPTRIGRYVIINAFQSEERSHLVQGPNKVPLSWVALEQYEESKDEYLIRHVPALVRQLLRDGYTNVTLHSILAFRRSYRGCSKEVRLEIIRILSEMGFRKASTGLDSYLANTRNMYNVSDSLRDDLDAGNS